MQNTNPNYPYTTSATFSTFYILIFSPISLNGLLSLTTPIFLDYIMSASNRFKLSY